MRYPSGHKQQTRAKILLAAGKVFRRQGYQATGVDKVMEEAGLTPGGFYAHFESKQALLAEALPHAGADASALRQEGLEGLSGRDWIDGFLRSYLSTGHVEQAEEGCPIVALVSEMSRADAEVKKAFEAMILSLAARLESRVEGDRAGSDRERAFAALATCVGGLGLARSVHDAGVADQILESCRDQARLILCGPDETTPRHPGQHS